MGGVGFFESVGKGPCVIGSQPWVAEPTLEDSWKEVSRKEKAATEYLKKKAEREY